MTLVELVVPNPKFNKAERGAIHIEFTHLHNWAEERDYKGPPVDRLDKLEDDY